MTFVVEKPQKLPRFSLLAGFGALGAYLLGSLPFVFIMMILKAAELASRSDELTSQEQSKILSDYLSEPGVLAGALFTQCLALFIYVWIVSVVRGTSNPFRDLGVRFTKFSPFYFFAGMGLQLVVGIVAFPIRLIAEEPQEQGVVTAVKDSFGPTFILMMLMVAFLVPIAEEVAFRGMFMRGLTKKVAPVFAVAISGSLFGLVHLLDISALQAIPSLVMVGVIFSAFAMYRGRLDAAIFMHMGFNFVTVLYIVATR